MRMSCREIISKIKRGTKFVEVINGYRFSFTATGKPRVIKFDDTKKQAIWHGRGEDGKVVEFCITEMLEHYGPYISLGSE